MKLFGVSVVTPSLNKSFKFQSDWPYNNSQVYLLNSIIEDLKEDEKRAVKRIDDGYVFSSVVNYPNNKVLVKQNVYVDKDGKINRTEVVDKDGNVQVAMKFQTIKYQNKFEDNYFELNSLLSKSYENKKDDKKEEVDDSNKKTENTASIGDVIYPMYLPNNTYLTNQERIDTDSGERLILTFGGDHSFVLIEETSEVGSENMIVPVSGEFDFLSDVIGVIGQHSLSWHSNGIDYYLAADAIETSELIDIAKSISVLPVSK